MVWGAGGTWQKVSATFQGISGPGMGVEGAPPSPTRSRLAAYYPSGRAITVPQEPEGDCSSHEPRPTPGTSLPLSFPFVSFCPSFPFPQDAPPFHELTACVLA